MNSFGFRKIPGMDRDAEIWKIYSNSAAGERIHPTAFNLADAQEEFGGRWHLQCLGCGHALITLTPRSIV